MSLIAAKPRLHCAPVPTDQKLAVTPEEAAGLTGVGRTTIYRAMRERELRRAKIGKRTLILRCDLQAWLDAKAAQTDAI